MTRQLPSPDSDNSEEARAFLQARVALFWKVVFFISVLSTAMGAIGAIARPGVDFVVVVASTVQAGAFWWLCSRGQRSVRFSRFMEAGGLLLNLTGGGFVGRYVLAGFIRDRALVTSEGVLMADAYVSMLLLGGIGMMVSIRAALIPSRPLRTVFVTALVGAPLLVTTALLVPTAEGGLSLRSGDLQAYLWLPGTAAMMWCFVIITNTVISWVIYGLRAEVREARRLGQYVLERKIGEGGMGEVYRARHGMMRRPTALKLVRAEQAGKAGLRRFEREVQLTARLTHPNTITIFDYGRTQDGVFYYAMELLDGANLDRIVKVGGPQTPARVVHILRMAAGALAEAHGIGLIHRDIKPANIMLCTQGGERDVVKVLDFGLVKELEVDHDVGLTGANTLTGTPLYMAPESIRAPESVDARTDLYALGAVAYFLLAGSDVFGGTSILEVCGKHLHQTPEPLSARGVTVPATLEAVVQACLEKEPDKRPQSASELVRLLEACALEAWDSTHAEAWWQAHRAELAGEVEPSLGEARTVAVDGAPRALEQVLG